MLEISEIFHSLQGEGPHSGTPAVFLRLSGCIEPLCPWCDTVYACGKGDSMSVEKIIAKISSFDTELVVITGGEPFLQWNNGLNDLENILLARGFSVQYETGGKVEIPSKTKGFVVCSPKFIDGEWVFKTVNLLRSTVFKFVVNNDYDAIKEFIVRYKIASDRVYIMPMGTDRQTQLDSFQGVWTFCVKNGYHFSPRLHIVTFNNERGV